MDVHKVEFEKEVKFNEPGWKFKVSKYRLTAIINSKHLTCQFELTTNQLAGAIIYLLTTDEVNKFEHFLKGKKLKTSISSIPYLSHLLHYMGTVYGL